MAQTDSKFVEFNVDIYPYTKGDRVVLDKDELDRVDTVARKRSIQAPYGTAKSTPAEKAADTQEGEVVDSAAATTN